jgi:hypothetical protein
MFSQLALAGFGYFLTFKEGPILSERDLSVILCPIKNTAIYIITDQDLICHRMKRANHETRVTEISELKVGVGLEMWHRQASSDRIKY